MNYRVNGGIKAILLTTLLVGAALAVSVSAAGPAGSLSPAHLRCEYRQDPLGIDVSSPRLCWMVESDARDQVQTAYRILAASSMEELDRGTGDLWDTGKVESDRTLHAEYQGKPLGSGAECFWKVKVWDRQGRPSSWSEPARWSMGLLNDSDWKAKWIGRDTPGYEIHDMYLHVPAPLHVSLGIKVPGPYATQKVFKGGSAKIYLPSPYLRKSFKAKPGLKRATVYATALGLYELYLNGERVGKDHFTPGWSDYNKRVYYQTYDVTGLVKEGGDNAMGAVLADGWYAGNMFNRGQRFYGSRLRLRAQLELEYDDGGTEVIATDESWKSSRGPILEADIQAGEYYDARREMPGWSSPGFDESGWGEVDVTLEVEPVVEAYPGIPVRPTMEIRPNEITEPKPGTFVFDLGQNFAGWARLRVKGKAGDKVVLRFGEMLKKDGTVYTANLRTARATDTYVLKGGGEEVWEPRFTFHGFRYVEVRGYPGRPTLDAITGIVAHSDLPVTGSLQTSDALLNQLYSNITWGQRSNYLEVPTDCPQRDERLGWTGDAQVFIRTASYNMEIGAFFTKWIVDLTDGQNPNGSLPDVAPAVISSAAAGWGDAGVICPYTIHLVYGDTRILDRHYQAMTRYMDFLERRSRNYLSPPLGFYGDWVNIDDPTPLDLVTTAYHAYDASLMAQIADALGKEEDARKYRELFENIKAAFSAEFVDGQGRIKGDSQTAYLMALGYDLLPEDLRPVATERLVGKIAANDYCLSTGFLGLKMLIPTLTEVGQLDLAYRLLTNRKFPSWGYSIDQGATTVWERWNSYTIEDGFGPVSMNSFNHYAFGSVGEWLFSTMAGIDTDGPGYKKIIIRPRPGGGITWVKAGYDSIRGKIRSDWRIDGDDFELKVTIPANTTARVYVPAADPARVTVDGRPVKDSGNVRLAGMEDGSAVYEAGSGTYVFVSRGAVTR